MDEGQSATLKGAGRAFVFVVIDVIRRLPEGEQEKSIGSFLCFKLARQVFGQPLWPLHGSRNLLSLHAYEVSKDALSIVHIGQPAAVVFCQRSPSVFPRQYLSSC